MLCTPILHILCCDHSLLYLSGGWWDHDWGLSPSWGWRSEGIIQRAEQENIFIEGKWKFRCRFWLIFNAWKLNNLSKITMKMFVYNFCIANLGFALPLPSTFFDRVDLWICIWLFCLMCVNTDTDKATLNILFVNIDILYSNRFGSVISIW